MNSNGGRKVTANLFYLQTYLDEISLGLFHRIMDTLYRNIHLHSIRVAVTLKGRCTFVVPFILWQFKYLD